MTVEVNAEDVNDEARLIMYRLVARRFRLDPGLVERARQRFQAEDDGSPSVRAIETWREILQADDETIRRSLVSQSELGVEMRKFGSFFLFESQLAPLQDVDYRRRIYRAAKRLVLRRAGRNSR